MTTKVGLYKDPRNKGRPWVVRWFGEYDPEKGKQQHYSKSFARKRDAEAFQAAKQVELDRGQPRDRPEEITIEEFVAKFLAVKGAVRRAATLEAYAVTLNQLINFAGPKTLLRHISPEVADRFVATRHRIAKDGHGYSLSSKNKHLRHCKAAFQMAVRWGYLLQSPFQHIREERTTARRWHHLKPTEFQTLLSAVDDLRWRSFYLLAYTSGARFGELFNLTWSDINFETGIITIRDRPGTSDMPPFQVKDHEARALLLPRLTIEALIAWQAVAPEHVPYILLTSERWRRVQFKWSLCRAGKPWKKNTKTGRLEWAPWQNRYMVNNLIRDMRVHCRKSGLRLTAPITVHTFRKSFAQNHAENGTPSATLKALMGHASITTTEKHYLQQSDANRKAAARRYEMLLSDLTCVKLAYEGTNEPRAPSPAAGVSP